MPASRKRAPKAKAPKTTARAAEAGAPDGEASSGREALIANARKALELRKAAPAPFRPENRTASNGMPPLPNTTIAPEGALEAEGAKPAMDRSHAVR